MKNRLKVLRAERDWSQQDLAARLEVSRQSVNAIEPLWLQRRSAVRKGPRGNSTSDGWACLGDPSGSGQRN